MKRIMRALSVALCALAAAGAACTESVRKDEAMQPDEKKTSGDQQAGEGTNPGEEMPRKAPGAGPGEHRIDRGAVGTFGDYRVAVWWIDEDEGALKARLSVDGPSEEGKVTVGEGDTVELGEETLRVVRVIRGEGGSYIVLGPAQE